MSYYLRQVSNADRDFLYRLKKACLKEYVAAIWGWDEADQRRRFISTFVPSASRLVVAYGRAIGQFAVEASQNEVFLSGIYLLPAYQGQGLGSHILSDLLANAGRLGLPVRLQVLLGNPARRLYDRLGFEVIDQTETHIIMRHGQHPGPYPVSRPRG
jgi:GNAT superfamily N-acetyltransferase